MTKKKIIFWGMGNVAKKFVSLHDEFMKEVEVLGFTDNDKNKKVTWGVSRIQSRRNTDSGI